MLCGNCGGTGLVDSDDSLTDVTCPVCDGECYVNEDESGCDEDGFYNDGE